MTKITETTEIIWFVAEDGKKFDTQRNCELYEEALKVSTILKDKYKYNFPNDVSRVHSLRPLPDGISALIGLYDTFEGEQGDWYCFMPKTEEDIEFIKTWVDYKSLEMVLYSSYSRNIRYVGWDFELAEMKVDEVYIVVIFEDTIKITTYKEIKKRLEDLIKEELEYLEEDIEMTIEVLGK